MVYFTEVLDYGWGIVLGATALYNAPTPAFVGLMGTTSTNAFECLLGRIAACGLDSYSCWYRNYGVSVDLWVFPVRI